MSEEPATTSARPEPAIIAAPAVEPAEEAPSLRRDLPAILLMGVMFVASIGFAMLFSITFSQQNVRAFADPTSSLNVVIYLGVVVLFTIGILILAKYWKPGIKIIILGSILLTIYYVLWPLLVRAMGPSSGAIGAPEVISGVVSVGLTALLWFYPEWYVIDIVGIAVAAGAAGIFGISLTLLPTLFLLVAFAVYDAIAVYRTKHMLALADSVLELRLPIMFVIPKQRGYSFLEETRRLKPDAPPKQKREAMFMGLGDAVIPGVLVVSAMTWLSAAGYAAGAAPAYVTAAPLVAGLPAWLVVALATLLGGLVGFGILMYFVAKGRPHAGLPLLNGGAIAGFLCALLPIYGIAPINPF